MEDDEHMNSTIVCKFGGSSLADASGFQKAKNILLANEKRRFAVPSAPGRRFDGDDKVTDLLYRCYQQVEKGEDCAETFAKITERYAGIARELGLTLDVMALLQDTRAAIERVRTPDFAASRGEYLNGVLLANYLGWDFIDAADVVRFDKQGAFAAEWTNRVLSEELKKHERAVIPGFYGAFPDGSVRTFSRGGSDISGALVARAAEAELYEELDGRLRLSHGRPAAWSRIPPALSASPTANCASFPTWARPFCTRTPSSPCTRPAFPPTSATPTIPFTPAR